MLYNTNKCLKGEICLSGDKSISHRALMIASTVNDDSVLYNLSDCEDVKTTIRCLKECNVSIKSDIMKGDYKIKGGRLKSPNKILNCDEFLNQVTLSSDSKA